MITACRNQSAVVEIRSALETAYAATLAGSPKGPLPIPPHWGGLRVVPVALSSFRPARTTCRTVCATRATVLRGASSAWSREEARAVRGADKTSVPEPGEDQRREPGT